MFIKKYNLKKLSLCMVLLVSLTGCGGSGTIEDIIDENKIPKINIKGTSPLSNASVVLTKSDGTEIATTSTDSNGSFLVELRMSNSEVIRIDLSVGSNSQMQCRAIKCAQNVLYGQQLKEQHISGINFTTYHYVKPSAEWGTIDESVSVNMLSTLTSVFVEKAITENSISANNTSLAAFNNLSIKAGKVILAALGLPEDNQTNLLSFQPAVLNENFINTNNKLLTLADNALTAATDNDQLVVTSISSRLLEIPLTEDIFTNNEALLSLLQLANKHNERTRNINELLIFLPALQNADIDFLLAVAHTSKDIDINVLLQSIEKLVL